MPRLPLVLIHGYSDLGASFAPWQRALSGRGYDVSSIHVGNYKSRTNELTIKDIAEGLDRALRIRAGLAADEPFDAIVHSTGMLVIRAWLTAYAKRRDRLKHLIGLAPATFGSPLAHKGRSWLGALFKGNRERGPDFLEAGDRILDGLELGSRFTWDLAHLDLLGDEPFYGATRSTPFVFVFCGTKGYTGLKSLVSNPGTDGTVRWAGAPLNTRKIILDLTLDPSRPGSEQRVSVADWKNVDVDLTPIAGVNHGTILSDPPGDLVEMVDAALRVNSAAGLEQWKTDALRCTKAAREKMDEWQQFVFRAIDERGDPVPDYNIQLFTRSARGVVKELRDFDLSVHPYAADQSFRCFHVNLTKLKRARLPNLWLRVIASSGSQLVGYHGFGSEKGVEAGDRRDSSGKWDGELDLSELVGDAEVKFFYPFTTTLVEVRLNRVPLPLSGRNEVAWF
jgi:pimeloyl-ACP methyl ester carboxylesterase